MTTPAKTEATKKTVSFTYEGDKYTIPTTKEWDLEVIEAVEDEKIVAVVRGILGAEQWAAFKSKSRTVDDLNSLFTAISKAAGLQGNS